MFGIFFVWIVLIFVGWLFVVLKEFGFFVVGILMLIGIIFGLLLVNKVVKLDLIECLWYE